MSTRQIVIAMSLGLAACSSPSKQGSARADSLQAVADSLHSQIKKAHDDSVRREATLPRTLSLLEDSLVVGVPGDKSHGYHALGFQLTQDGRCRVKGRLEVLRGGNKDVLVALFGADEFTNWKNNPNGSGRAYFSAGPQTIITIDTPITSAGTYWLAISNRFSTFATKTVTGTVAITCIGQPTPVQVKE